jgi:sulfur relay (sulfurtransferase) DsrC/TusE family protein
MKRETSMPKTNGHPPDLGDAACECDWTPSLAECLARVFGIAPLSEAHWRVISECREEWARSGRVPELSILAERSHMSVGQLEMLFPAGQAAFAWILAGVVPPSYPPSASPVAARQGAAFPVADAAAPQVGETKGGRF